MFSFPIQINEPSASAPVSQTETPARRRNSGSLPQTELTGTPGAGILRRRFSPWPGQAWVQLPSSLLPSTAAGCRARNRFGSSACRLSRLPAACCTKPVIPRRISGPGARGSRSPPGTADAWEMLACVKHLLRLTLAAKKEIKRESPPSSCLQHLLSNNLAYSLNTGRLLPSR